MATTPLWVPLLVAGMGLLATVAGTVLGAVLAAANANRREDVRWARERERERDVQLREDAQRTFEQRRGCYIDYHEHLRLTALAIHDAAYGLGPVLEFGWQLPLYESLLRLRIFATTEATELAGRAYDATYRWGDAQMKYKGEDEHHFLAPGEEEQDEAVSAYLSIIRRDLGIDMRT